MIKRFFLLLVLSATSLITYAQNSSSVLLQIEDEIIYTDEFWAIYQKNNKINQQSGKTSIDEYLDLFVNFKLKVKEAKDARMDTASAFLNELNGYRQQLVKPYLVIEEADEQTAREVYNRMQSNVRASHILLRLDENATGSDTLAVYDMIQKIRHSILNGDYSFAQAAVLFSEDQSAKDADMGAGRPPRPGNKGDLGYFGVFDMVYPFEEAAYSLKIGEISNPVCTRFGYHLLYLTDKIHAFGQVKAAHLYIQHAEPSAVIDSAKVKIDELYERIKNGESFEKLVQKYSDDKGSSDKNGELPVFTANRMVPEFIATISKMNIGQISEPISTSFGWHIIKYLEKQPLESFEKLKPEIIEKLKRDIRSKKGELAKIEQIKKDENFTEFPESLNEVLSFLNVNFFIDKLDTELIKRFSKPLFNLKNNSFKQFDFLNFIYKNRNTEAPERNLVQIHTAYRQFVDQSCLKYEEDQLEEKYPEFKMIMKEYREGILLFDLMDKKVWSKASSDTLGLKQYFEENQQKYQWDKRAALSVFNLNDNVRFSDIKNQITSEKSDSLILADLKNDSLNYVRFEKLKIQKTDKSDFNAFEWKKNAVYTTYNQDGKEKAVVIFRDILNPQQKKLNETKGMVISDYQSYLENKWLTELKEKYKVIINKKALRKLKKKDIE